MPTEARVGLKVVLEGVQNVLQEMGLISDAVKDLGRASVNPYNPALSTVSAPGSQGAIQQAGEPGTFSSGGMPIGAGSGSSVPMNTGGPQQPMNTGGGGLIGSASIVIQRADIVTILSAGTVSVMGTAGPGTGAAVSGGGTPYGGPAAGGAAQQQMARAGAGLGGGGEDAGFFGTFGQRLGGGIPGFGEAMAGASGPVVAGAVAAYAVHTGLQVAHAAMSPELSGRGVSDWEYMSRVIAPVGNIPILGMGWQMASEVLHTAGVAAEGRQQMIHVGGHAWGRGAPAPGEWTQMAGMGRLQALDLIGDVRTMQGANPFGSQKDYFEALSGMVARSGGMPNVSADMVASYSRILPALLGQTAWGTAHVDAGHLISQGANSPYFIRELASSAVVRGDLGQIASLQDFYGQRFPGGDLSAFMSKARDIRSSRAYADVYGTQAESFGVMSEREQMLMHGGEAAAQQLSGEVPNLRMEENYLRRSLANMRAANSTDPEAMAEIERLRQRLMRVVTQEKYIPIQQMEMTFRGRGEIEEAQMSRYGAQATTSLVSGAGTLAVRPRQDQQISVADTSVHTEEQHLQAMKQNGVGGEALERQMAAVEQAKARAATLRTQLGDVRLPAGMEDNLAQSRYNIAVASSVPGGYMNVRQAHFDQMQNLQSEGQYLNRALADPNLNDEGRFNIRQRIREVGLQQLQSFNQLSMGWQDRLISQTLGTPGNFSFIASQFALKDAVGAGVVNPAFGATATQRPMFLDWAQLANLPGMPPGVRGPIPGPHGQNYIPGFPGGIAGGAGAGTPGGPPVRIEVTIRWPDGSVAGKVGSAALPAGPTQTAGGLDDTHGAKPVASGRQNH